MADDFASLAGLLCKYTLGRFPWIWKPNVFLPSYRDYMNVDYGFINSEVQTSTRTSRTSEWPGAWGASYEKSDVTNKWNGNSWTRSPKATYMRDVHASKATDI